MAMTPAPDAAESELDRGPTRAAPVEPRGQVPLATATAYGSQADRYVAECAVFGVADAINGQIPAAEGRHTEPFAESSIDVGADRYVVTAVTLVSPPALACVHGRAAG